MYFRTLIDFLKRSKNLYNSILRLLEYAFSISINQQSIKIDILKRGTIISSRWAKQGIEQIAYKNDLILFFHFFSPTRVNTLTKVNYDVTFTYWAKLPSDKFFSPYIYSLFLVSINASLIIIMWLRYNSTFS